jgi:hypothetical protein
MAIFSVLGNKIDTKGYIASRTFDKSMRGVYIDVIFIDFKTM